MTDYRSICLSGIKALYEEYSNCKACALCEERDLVVFGAGMLGADLMFIGDAPTRDDERGGRPFRGKAGEYLSSALEEAGADPKTCYFTNMVLCRPTEEQTGANGSFKVNRAPLASELEACRGRLLKEIYLVDPKVIVLLGATATKLVSPGKLQNIAGGLFYTKLEGKTGQELRFPTIPTWHPLLLLRDNSRDAGSPAEQFFSHIKLAVNIVRITKEMGHG